MGNCLRKNVSIITLLYVIPWRGKQTSPAKREFQYNFLREETMSSTWVTKLVVYCCRINHSSITYHTTSWQHSLTWCIHPSRRFLCRGVCFQLQNSTTFIFLCRDNHAYDVNTQRNGIQEVGKKDVIWLYKCSPTKDNHKRIIVRQSTARCKNHGITKCAHTMPSQVS